VRLNCRGSLPESVTYGASLALWQRRLVEQADAVLLPSRFARERLRALGAPLPWERVAVLPPPLRVLEHDDEDRSPGRSTFALVVSRLAAEKGVDVAIDACRLAGIALVVAGDGPEHDALRARAAGADVTFLGRVDDATLSELRGSASIALAPSRSAETFGLAVAESMAAALPVAASRVGALPELLEPDALVAPGDAEALAAAVARLAGDRAAGRRNLERVRAVCSPQVVAEGLRRAYGDPGAP
jgi:glycosyltransferase involved in cell wall biosynthesis